MQSASSLDEARGPSRLLAIVRTWPGLTAIALMALVGLGASIYLTVVHYNTKVTLYCTNGGLVDCQQVTSSVWSMVPGTTIPITIPGMLWFLVSGGLAVWALAALARDRMEPARARLTQFIWSAAGLLCVLYLVFVEIALVQKLCEWCTAIHLLTLATFLIALVRWQHRNEPDALEEQAPAAPVHRAPQQALSRRARRTLEQRGRASAR